MVALSRLALSTHHARSAHGGGGGEFIGRQHECRRGLTVCGCVHGGLVVRPRQDDQHIRGDSALQPLGL